MFQSYALGLHGLHIYMCINWQFPTACWIRCSESAFCAWATNNQLPQRWKICSRGQKSCARCTLSNLDGTSQSIHATSTRYSLHPWAPFEHMASFSQLRSEQQLDDSKGREFDKSACSWSSVTAMGIEVIRMFKPIVLKYNQDYIPSNLSRVPALVPQHHAPQEFEHL